MESLEARQLLASDLIISEFLASNSQGLQDDDGDRSDWIELYNRGSEAVNLNGWHLSDDRDDLTKWEFPSVELDPGETLIVFASDKDRDDPARPLHTNFRLSAGGEDVVLVSRDGSTIVSEISSYPQQFADVSYGLEQVQVVNNLVRPTSASRLRLPASASDAVPTATWTSTEFNDAGWLSVPAAIGYDTVTEDGNFLNLVEVGGRLTTMQGSASSALLRTSFQIDGDVPAYDALQLRLNYDDGFVAFLNGTEVARRNAPDALAWDSVATQQHGGVADSVSFGDFLDPDRQDAFNRVGSAAWVDGRLQLTPAAANQTGAAWLREPLSFGPDYSFTASMMINVHSPGGSFGPDGLDADGRGAHGMTFVIQDGGENRLGGPGGQLGLDSSGMSFVAIEFDTMSSGSFDGPTSPSSHIGIDTSTHGSLAQVAVPRFNGHPSLAQPGPGVDLRYVWVEYNGLTDLMQVYFSASAQRPSEPTLTTTVDLENIFGGLPELTAGWTAATGAGYNAHDVLRFDFTSGTGQSGLDTRVIDLTDHQGLLRTGSNVLAIHGLNVNTSDNDFLLRPELVGITRQWGELKYFNPPTPGEINGTGQAAPSGEVAYSATTQTFVSAFNLSLTTPNSNGVIRYTTDGSLPTENSPLYSSPIRISSTTRIRARAFEPGRGPGPVSSESFVQLDSTLTNFEGRGAFQSNLPLMIFESFGTNVESQNRLMVPISGVFIDPGEDGVANILDAGEFAGRGGMRIRGQTSEGFAKKQFSLELWDEFNSDARPIEAGAADDKSASFFGLPAESDWVLNGPYSDKTQLNNYLTFLWSNNAGLYAPRARLVEVFLNENGGRLNYPSDYRGTYVLLEKIKRDDDRVDIAALTPDDNSLPEISGGYIWKKDKPGVGDRPFTTSRGQELRMVEPDDTQITTQQKNWLRDHINQFEAALYGPNFADPETGYAKFIDVDSWAETWLLVEMTKNIDGFRLSTYYHKDRDGKIKQGPAWDYNLSLANGNYLNGAFPEGWYHDGLSSADYPYWERLFQDPNFEQRVIDRWHELRQTVWSTENLLADVDAAVSMLSNDNPRLERPAAGEPSNPISRNFSRWGTLNNYLWPNCFFGQGSCPSSPLPGGRQPSSYGDYIFILKDFVSRRTAWMDQQFPRGPVMLPGGGEIAAGTSVSITVPAGSTAYYTLDDTDPRSPVSVNREDVLIASGATAQVLVPQNNQLITVCDGLNLANPSACFISPSYVAGTHGESWTEGTMGIGYDLETDYDPYIGTDLEAAMYNKTGSAYVRIPFQVTAAQKARIDNLNLRVRYDDGFVAYMWSDSLRSVVEVARANAPGTATRFPINELAFDANATANHDDTAAVDFVTFNLGTSLNYLRVGTNYLVLQGLNAADNSSDFLLDVELVGTSTTLETGPGVIRYTGPFTIDRNTRVNARLLHDTRQTWSGMTSELYVVDTPTLAISEIHYHPSPPTPAESAVMPMAGQDDFEFIEVVNTGTTTAHLVGVYFDDGIEFAFGNSSLQPGAYGVIAKNAEAFRLRYGNGISILGEFADGALSNTGERLEIVDGIGRRIVDVTYSDSSLWPQAADGVGASLEMIDPLATPISQYDKYYRWQSSLVPGGTPGRAATDKPAIVINEVLSNTDPDTGLSDSIELLNRGNVSIDLGGWYLSDSAGQLLKYRFPAGTTLAAGGYLVVNESQINPTPTMPAPHHFSLNGSFGDRVWLTRVDGSGTVTGLVDDVHFNGTRSGESLGRIPNGSGFLTPLMQNTLGRPNQNPRVGPILISELMYHPVEPSDAALAIDPDLARSDLEFIEITNTSATEVDLTHWRIRGGADFDFPHDLRLSAGASLLLVPFNPDRPDNVQQTLAFRTHYGIGSEVKLVGGLQGRLTDSGDRIRLERPDGPVGNDPNLVPRVQEDEVIYDDLPPWPTNVDGLGASLQRTSSRAYGNDPASWFGADPNPGTYTGDGTVAGDFNGDGVVSVADVNLFCSAMRQTSPSLDFDLTGDGRVNSRDRDFLIQGILQTSYGDANLDGVFNSTDLILVFQAGQYEDAVPGNSTWATGDWDCSGDFNTSDMVLAFQSGAYAAGAVVAASPASSSATPSVAALDLALTTTSPARRNNDSEGSSSERVRITIERPQILDAFVVDPVFAEFDVVESEESAEFGEDFWVAEVDAMER